MKKNFTLSILLTSSLILANAQVWEASSADFSASLMGASIYAIDDSVAWSWGDELDEDNQNTFLNTTITRTQDGGVTWESIGFPSQERMFTTSISAISSEIAWVSMVGQTVPDQGNYLFKTIDAGQYWTAVMHPVSVFIDFVYMWSEDEVMILGDPDSIGFEIYKTYDSGISWERIQNLPEALTGEFVRTDNYAVYGDEFWFATDLGRIYHSLDKGETWEVWSAPENDKEASRLEVSHEGDVFIAYLKFFPVTQDWESDLYRRNADDGQWVKMNGTVIPYFVQDVQVIPNTHTLLATLLSSIRKETWISYNRGDSWQVVDTTSRANLMDFYSPETGYATEFNTGLDFSPTSIYNFIGSPLSGLIQHTPLLNADVSVSPNPTADFVMVSLKATTPHNYWILLNSLSGELYKKEYYSLVDEINHTIDMREIPSGVYTISIADENGVMTERIIKL